jgi:hypothetical protein
MTTRCGRLQCLLLAAILAMGAGLAWGVVGGILVATVETVFRPTRVFWENEGLVILRDGTPIIQSNRYYGVTSNEFHTLDGKEFKRDGQPMLHAESACRLSGPLSSRHRFPRMSWSQRVKSIDLSNETIWYFVHDGWLQGHGYFAGYDKQTRLPVGYIGRAGFRPDEPPENDQFPVDGRRLCAEQAISHLNWSTTSEEWNAEGNIANCLYLATEDGVVLVNLASRSARAVTRDAKFTSISSMNGLLVIRTPDSVRILQPSGKQLSSYPLPPALRSDVDMELFGLAKKRIVLYDSSCWPVPHPPRDAFWLDADGKIARHEKVNMRDRGQPDWISPTAQNLIMSMAAVPSPGTLVAGVGFDLWREHDFDRLQRVWPEWWPALLATTIISAVLAVVSYRRQRKYAWSWPGMWAAFVLLFGVPAYIGYLVHRHWPARLPCPKCGRLVPRDRPACAACHQDFPAPASKGIEVFA